MTRHVRLFQDGMTLIKLQFQHLLKCFIRLVALKLQFSISIH